MKSIIKIIKEKSSARITALTEKITSLAERIKNLTDVDNNSEELKRLRELSEKLTDEKNNRNKLNDQLNEHEAKIKKGNLPYDLENALKDEIARLHQLIENSDKVIGDLEREVDALKKRLKDEETKLQQNITIKTQDLAAKKQSLIDKGIDKASLKDLSDFQNTVSKGEDENIQGYKERIDKIIEEKSLKCGGNEELKEVCQIQAELTELNKNLKEKREVIAAVHNHFGAIVVSGEISPSGGAVYLGGSNPDHTQKIDCPNHPNCEKYKFLISKLEKINDGKSLEKINVDKIKACQKCSNTINNYFYQQEVHNHGKKCNIF